MEGTMASGYSSHNGGASEYLCIVTDPVSGTRVSTVKAYQVRVEFSGPSDTVFSKVNMLGALTNQDPVCAICRSSRSVQEALESKRMSSATGSWVRRAADETMNRTPTASQSTNIHLHCTLEK